MSYLSVRSVPLFRIAAICVVVLTALAVGVDDADARRKKKRIGHGRPPLSHIVLDATTGETLEAFKADEQRYPASLTKVMTLYLLFEQIEAGTLALSTPLKVSRYAASRPPTKLGLKPGSTIRVDDAIKALVTKSANDVAVVVAEAIGGSEDEFAKLMTRKAHSLGMSRTVYANASGLPNPDQVTTARDQAILGRAIQWRFPGHYQYFATESFRFHGRLIRTHNRLLGRVRGVDGIKTGYTRASGYNLVTSVRRDRRHIVAVVIGGRSGRSRDAFMRKLIQDYIDDASPLRVARLPTTDVPMPPARPADVRKAIFKLAAVRVEPAEPGEAVQIAGKTDLPDDGDTVTTPRVVKPGVTLPVAPRHAAATTVRAVAAPLATSGVVVADASLGHSAARTTPAVVMAVAVRSGVPGFPGWLPYLLVVLVGGLGSLLFAFFTAAPRR